MIKELRVLFWIILGVSTPFGLLLFFFPGYSNQYWGWAIASPLSSILIAAGFLGLSLYSILVLKGNSWPQTQNGVEGLVLFFAILLVATLLDWRQFSPYRPVTLLWLCMCTIGAFALPVVYRRQRAVVAVNQTRNVDTSEHISKPLRVILAVRGFVYLSLAMLWLAQADIIAEAWPWRISALELRIFAAQIVIVGWSAIIVLSGRFSWGNMRLGMMLGGIIGLLQLLGLIIHSNAFTYSGLGIFLQLMFLEWLIAALLLSILYEWKKIP
jgi:hypothetical protein